MTTQNAMYNEKPEREPSTEREPVSKEIMHKAARIAEKAEFLEKRLHGKLEPVMQLSCPSLVPQGKPPLEVYPPLFEDLRSRLDVIDCCLNSMEDAISRTEL